MFTLQNLIEMRRNERGWSYADLEVRSDHKITRGRWQQLATRVRMEAFPNRDNIPIIAQVLEVDQTTVVLALAKSLGLDVQGRGSDLVALMPAGTDRLSTPVRDAILAVIRATVLEALAQQDGEVGAPQTTRPGPSVLEWDKTAGVPHGEQPDRPRGVTEA